MHWIFWGYAYIGMLCLWGAPLVAQERLEVTLETAFFLDGPTQLIKYTALLPPEIPGRQEQIHVSYSHPPHRTFMREGQHYAEFRFVRPKEDFKLRITLSLRTFPFDLASARRYAGPYRPEAPRHWLGPAPFLEVDSPAIQLLAQAVRGPDWLSTLHGCYRAVRDTLRYDASLTGELGALAALEGGHGDCTEYADLLTALCRANGLPARTVNGLALGNTGENPNHHWTEVLLNDLGWVPVDPTLGATLPQAALVHQHPETRYVLLSRQRVDPICGSSNNHWQAWGRVRADYRYTSRIRPWLQAGQE